MHFKSAQTTASIFHFQETVLKVTGFMPMDSNCSVVKKIAASAFHCIGVSILLGTLFSVTLYIATVFWGLFGPGAVASTIGNPLIEWLTYIPYCFTNLRGFIVCSLFWFHGKHWSHIKHRADELIHATFAGPHKRAVLVRKWKNTAVVVGFISILLVCMWETNSWIHYQDQDPQRYNLQFNDAVAPLPMKMTVWQYVITWTLWSTLPFCLSQQIFITVIMLAWILNGCINKLNAAILEERAYFRGVVSSHSDQLWSDSKALLVLAEKMHVRITALRHRRLKMVTFCEEVTKTYGLILFAIYGLDVFTVCGFVAAIVADTEKFLTAYTLNFLSLALYGMYATVFMVPMVLVYEKGSYTTLNLYRLMDATSPLIERPEGQQLRLAMKTFLGISKDQILIFHGAELLHITRNLIAATITFLFSCVVIMHELLLHSKAAAACNHQNAQNTLTVVAANVTTICH
ncbi:uncharacterized protein LOC129588284 [Paramacrobiotus metropolitanus]|uniref:uncharacterized protein LOC129588284 n=1 Tax=Paramacrobiotus metropolitanus TaxID=2943436 RepID=UPI002445F909|nr:uncharacterized protein LOC129588284 [Paramacrobiotus metropolitanus]